MSVKGMAFMAAAGLLALPALAGATRTSAAATSIRISDRPAFIRVEVHFPRGTIKARSVSAGPVTKTEASVELRGADPTTVAAARRDGLDVGVVRNAHGVAIQANFASGRIKYLSYPEIWGNGIVLNLWKSAPYGINKPIHTCKGLTLIGWSANGSGVVVGGREHGIFENQFQVVVRGGKGAVLGRKIVRGPRRWRTRVRYHVAFSQPGWVEAVALSPKDGSLACIAELGINLPAT
jgi:hypothetical protein